jgi:SAM-dependent methyltransferase
VTWHQLSQSSPARNLHASIKVVEGGVTSTTTDWKANLTEELDFWRGWLTLMLSGDKPEYAKRLESGYIPDFITDLLRSPPEGDIKALDVGSGPLTTLGGLWRGGPVQLVAVDALADEYNQLMAELGVVPVVAPSAVRGENLVDAFGDDAFDVTHAANALDHCEDPIATVIQMMRVTRPGGVMVLFHTVDVGEVEGYHGLHQWNLHPENGDMAIWGKGERVLLSRLVPGAVVSVWVQDQFVHATVVKDAHRPCT